MPVDGERDVWPIRRLAASSTASLPPPHACPPPRSFATCLAQTQALPRAGKWLKLPHMILIWHHGPDVAGNSSPVCILSLTFVDIPSTFPDNGRLALAHHGLDFRPARFRLLCCPFSCHLASASLLASKAIKETAHLGPSLGDDTTGDQSTFIACVPQPVHRSDIASYDLYLMLPSLYRLLFSSAVVSSCLPRLSHAGRAPSRDCWPIMLCSKLFHIKSIFLLTGESGCGDEHRHRIHGDTAVGPSQSWCLEEPPCVITLGFYRIGDTRR